MPKLPKKSGNLPDFAKIAIFKWQPIKKKYILKGQFTILCKVRMVLFTET